MRGFSAFACQLFLVSLTALASSPTKESQYFSVCGSYELTGKLKCSPKDCSLVLFHGSRAEFTVALEHPSPEILYQHYDGATIKTRVEVKSTQVPIRVRMLEKIPKRV